MLKPWYEVIKTTEQEQEDYHNTTKLGSRDRVSFHSLSNHHTNNIGKVLLISHNPTWLPRCSVTSNSDLFPDGQTGLMCKSNWSQRKPTKNDQDLKQSDSKTNLSNIWHFVGANWPCESVDLPRPSCRRRRLFESQHKSPTWDTF